MAWLGLGWHFVESAIAFAAGLAAGSIALVGFGADSVIEAWAALAIAAVALREGREAWRGNACDCCA